MLISQTLQGIESVATSAVPAVLQALLLPKTPVGLVVGVVAPAVAALRKVASSILGELVEVPTILESLTRRRVPKLVAPVKFRFL